MKVLFVCQGNMVRSQIAELLYNHTTGTQNARSAGTEATLLGRISRRAETVVQEIGLKLEGQEYSKQVTPDMVEWADKVVLFPVSKTPDFLTDNPKVEFWDIEDLGHNQEGETIALDRQVRDEIQRRVQELRGAYLEERIVAKGKIFELVQTTQPDGRVFEMARRAPGTRIIIADESERKILLAREFRPELNAWDFRLPGGKVFDTLDEFEAHRKGADSILEAATRKAIDEAKEEVGITAEDMNLVSISKLGSTVEWDLFVFEALGWHATGKQELGAGEVIEADNWFSFEEAEQMILDGKMQEQRIALIVLQWIKKQ